MSPGFKYVRVTLLIGNSGKPAMLSRGAVRLTGLCNQALQLTERNYSKSG